MKTIVHAIAAGLLLAAATTFPVGAQEGPVATAGDLAISAPWSRQTAKSARNGAAFMAITNNGSEPDRLVSASSDVAGRVELHTHAMDNGVMKMRQIEAIDVPAGETVMLQPGSLHIMLIDLHQPLTEGENFEIEMTFEKAGNVETSVPVMSVRYMPDSHTGGGMKHGHGMKSGGN
ncbi:MAG: copper chaperone PCu(A)C [Geminicoccaceae bacterium]